MSRLDDVNALERAPAAGLNAARWSVSTIFLLNGAGIGVWAAHVPLVQARAGIDTGVLGFLLLTIAGGAISAMPLSGWMAGRWGTRAVVVGAGLLFALTSALLMNVGGVVPLFLAAFAFGASNGVLDVAMNANASEVEAARGIPTMSSFHGFFSLGGLIGAALTYIVWFRGLARLGPAAIAPLGFLSPLVAVVLGWGLLGQDLSPLQIAGMAVVLGSVWLSQRAQAAPAASTGARPHPAH